MLDPRAGLTPHSNACVQSSAGKVRLCSRKHALFHAIGIALTRRSKLPRPQKTADLNGSRGGRRATPSPQHRVPRIRHTALCVTRRAPT